MGSKREGSVPEGRGDRRRKEGVGVTEMKTSDHRAWSERGGGKTGWCRYLAIGSHTDRRGGARGGPEKEVLTAGYPAEGMVRVQKRGKGESGRAMGT